MGNLNQNSLIPGLFVFIEVGFKQYLSCCSPNIHRELSNKVLILFVLITLKQTWYLVPSSDMVFCHGQDMVGVVVK